MRHHLRPLSRPLPAPARSVQEYISYISLATSILYLIRSIADTFGLQIPQKINDDSE